jgi:hypothetical protein
MSLMEEDTFIVNVDENEGRETVHVAQVDNHQPTMVDGCNDLEATVDVGEYMIDEIHTPQNAKLERCVSH